MIGVVVVVRGRGHRTMGVRIVMRTIVMPFARTGARGRGARVLYYI